MNCFNKILRLAFIFIFLLDSIYCASPLLQSTCKERETCDKCISVGCAWCKELRNPDSQKPRCQTLQSQMKGGCPQEHIVKAESSKTITEDQSLSKSMRIRPQIVEATLGVGEKVTIDLKYNDNEDKPLDLYYIMDLSATMKDDKETVSRQADNMVSALQKITKKVRLGFGAYIDKPVLPFIRASQSWPSYKLVFILCNGRNDEYDIPYGFKNRLSLTANTREFQKAVKEAKISQNLDLPEGTLDALMQAITCTNEIGWKNESRKLIVVATDGIFHIAGDGKLAGIVRPNDMQCHLKDNEYTHSKKLDYPTIGEMNHVIFEHRVYVIFAVSNSDKKDAINMYKELENHISQSAALELESDSRNVVQKIKQKYQELSTTVKLNVEKAPPNVKITIEAKCPRSQKFNDQDFCTGVNLGEDISFKINLELMECPDEDSYNTNWDKIIVSFFELSAREKLEIKLNYNCKCESCSRDSEIIRDEVSLSRFCSGSEATDHISCGSCVCRQNRYGDACQCSIRGGDNQGNQTNCIDPNSQSQICSGRGECKCGKCVCGSGFNGRYCEDSTSGCQNRRSKFPSRLCSDEGHCIKGKCSCIQGFEGQYCQCQSSKKQSCVEPGKTLSELCNGHGECVCQEEERAYCACTSNYAGRYCGVCKLNCPSSGEKVGTRCEDKFLRDCVVCRVRHFNESDPDQKRSREKCLSKCTPAEKRSSNDMKKKDVTNYEFVDFTGPESLDDKFGDATECQVRYNSSCTVKFKYEYNRDDTLYVYYKPKALECEKEPPILLYIFGTILGVLLAGIVGLLVWKLATYLHDRREYKRFVKEITQAKWQTSGNPLYNKPMSEFQNPAYQD